MKFRIKTKRDWKTYYVQKSADGVDWEPILYYNPCYYSVESAKRAIDEYVKELQEPEYTYIDYVPLG